MVSQLVQSLTQPSAQSLTPSSAQSLTQTDIQPPHQSLTNTTTTTTTAPSPFKDPIVLKQQKEIRLRARGNLNKILCASHQQLLQPSIIDSSHCAINPQQLVAAFPLPADLDISGLARRIESAMFRLTGELDASGNPVCGDAYKNKFMTLHFNLKDPDNARKVLQQSVTPVQLVKMSSEELANATLKEMKQKAHAQSIRESIKVKDNNSVLVKKTHKGDVLMRQAPAPLLLPSLSTSGPELVLSEISYPLVGETAKLQLPADFAPSTSSLSPQSIASIAPRPTPLTVPYESQTFAPHPPNTFHAPADLDSESEQKNALCISSPSSHAPATAPSTPNCQFDQILSHLGDSALLIRGKWKEPAPPAFISSFHIPESTSSVDRETAAPVSTASSFAPLDLSAASADFSFHTGGTDTDELVISRKTLWRGKLWMATVAELTAEISMIDSSRKDKLDDFGVFSVAGGGIPPSQKDLEISGRIPLKELSAYVDKCLHSSARMVSLFELRARDLDQTDFQILFDHLRSRNRGGVVPTDDWNPKRGGGKDGAHTASSAHYFSSVHLLAVKDMYLFPIAQDDPPPPFLSKYHLHSSLSAANRLDDFLLAIIISSKPSKPIVRLNSTPTESFLNPISVSRDTYSSTSDSVCTEQFVIASDVTQSGPTTARVEASMPPSDNVSTVYSLLNTLMRGPSALSPLPPPSQ